MPVPSEGAGSGPGQVRVAVSHCGLCHSDLSILDGVFPSALPIVLGHEAAGLVIPGDFTE